MVRNSTSPALGAGAVYSSRRKSDVLGSPTGRETRTTRLAWDMIVSSGLLLFRHCERSEAIHSSQRKRMDCVVASFLAMTACTLNVRPRFWRALLRTPQQRSAD